MTFRFHTIRRCVLQVALLAALVRFAGSAEAGAAVDVSSVPPQTSPHLLDQIGIDQKPGVQVPLDLEFLDEDGQRVRLGDYIGDKPVLLNLVYFECPMLCNMTMDGLIRALKTLEFSAGDEFEVLTVSFDPREGPSLASGARKTALTRYDRDGAEAGWHFLTGDEAQIKQLTETVGFRYAYDPKIGQYAHAAGLIVLTPEGKVSRYLNGVEFMARDLRLSLIEATSGEIAEPSDQVLLFCYQYNPATGKYGLVIQNVIVIAGMTTVALLAGGIGLLLWRERRRTAPHSGIPALD